MTKRKIMVLTGTRAEYGLLKPLLGDLARRESLKVGLVAVGAHLSHEFGHTIDEIVCDGYDIWASVDSLLASDSPSAICKSMALVTMGVSEALERFAPDLLVLLGDRYELLAAAQAAMIHNVPIAHLHGGEATEGLIDEAIRHSVTKMSHLHFVSTEEYRQRVLQLGEQPERVYKVGAIGLDNIKNLNPVSLSELESDLGLNLSKTSFLITYHPVTLNDRQQVAAIKNLLAALARLTDANFVFTYPNSDTFGRDLLAPIQEFVKHRPGRAVLVKSLGVRRYLSLMSYVSGVVGNSSSGIIEAPSYGVPTVNIGIRQQGRVMARSVINCCDDENSIFRALEQAMSKSFLSSLRGMKNPYGDGNTACKVGTVLESASLEGILKKSFYNMGEFQ